MADVSKIFKPRRGLASTMSGAGKKDIVLAKGEMFVEAPSTGMGTGESKIKIGDGTTAYASLPYALGDTSNNKITFTSNTSTTVATALNSVASGNALKTIIAGLKQAISLCNTSITQLNDDLNGISFGQDTEGNWGYKLNGADTVYPFKSSNDPIKIDVLILQINTGSEDNLRSTPLQMTIHTEKYTRCTGNLDCYGGTMRGGIYLENGTNIFYRENGTGYTYDLDISNYDKIIFKAITPNFKSGSQFIQFTNIVIS